MEAGKKVQEFALNRTSSTATAQIGKSTSENHQNSMHECGFLL
jgi:hypothetical protein